ncbi:MAG TPA: family 16 glycoside hydrolase, partial [Sphingomicrobium sp.]
MSILAAALALMVQTPAATPQMRPEDTEQWTPKPPVVVPGEAVRVRPPSDAIVLLGDSGLGEWVSVNDGSPAKWEVDGNVMTVKKGTGNIETRRRFTNYQLHIEWRIPEHINGEGQGRGNSGLFLAST